ncbi:uncharacterized protein LY89DRAFT_732717 [Mollisia scopiformis]|uniref:Extracellular membrane protein CFEM domain-containing protein n=1 Tax=Mollisia scopiformis TaxID=149040 RepID=A0A194XCY4_MOLSC|nr:uncharacterized protein LY89DRAFT_732717 [Mollisia scopiformis]KUJ18019.1 hypothetical protein LY89DRAFT_732717 [Mollisia scopiformis]
MALSWPSLIILIFAYTTHAANYTLTPELMNFIPSCAQECFISFLESNFPYDLCGKTPTLNCLCTHNSTSGYTVGEGAVQCIISEDNIGFCQGNSSKPTVVTNAYAMCSGEPDALPETHGTITATLIVQTSMPSIVLVAPPATTSSSGSSSTLQTTSSGFKTMTTGLPTASAVKTTSMSSTASAEAATGTGAATPTSLTKSQIVGITVASVGGTAVMLGIVICFACWRRRKLRRARESDLIPFQLDPPAHLIEKKKYHYSFRGPVQRIPGGTANGIAAKVPPRAARAAPPVPPRLDTSDPLMFSRRSIRPETIGVAISPDNKGSMAAQQRRSSRLLPEKPTLKLKMPQQEREYTSGLSFSQPVVGPSVMSRQSVATQFEEDIETADTAVNTEDSWTRKSTDRILYNSPSNGRTVRPVYPEEDRDEYPWRPGQPADVNGNPDIYVRPLSIAGRKMASFSQPRKPDAYPLTQLAIPESRPLTGSSSVYSGRGSVPGSDAGRNNPARRSYQQAGPYDSETIELTFAPEEVEPPRTGGMRTGGMKDLSPVVESPASGRSPVSYPKIPESISPTIMRMNYGPPPPQPDFTKAMGSGQAQNNQPWRAAEIKAQREREQIARQQAQDRARSPPQTMLRRAASARVPRQQNSTGIDTMNFPAPPSQAVTRSPTTQEEIHPALRTNEQEETIEPPPRSQTAPLTDATGGWRYNPYIPTSTRSRSQNQNQRPQPSPYQTQRQNSAQIASTTTSSSTTLPTSLNPLMSPTWQPQIQLQPQQPPPTTYHPPTRSSSALSSHSHTSKTSTSSSLLAKRLGEQKASRLALQTDEGKRRQQAKWRVLGKEEQDRAKEGNWRPMLGRKQGFGMGGGGDIMVQFAGEGEGQGREFERMDLPATPGWLPRLTPTRRGDELFLSVQ